MNRVFKISIVFIQISFFLIIYMLDIECVFKKYLNISCPGCGMTRAFLSIINLDIIGALSYNILSIFLFIFLVILNSILVYDIIFNSHKLNKLLIYLKKYNYLFLILLIISMIKNNFFN